MITALTAVAVLASGAVLTACGSGEAQPSRDPSVLNDKTFLSTRVDGDPIPGGGPLEVSFTPGRIAATAGCNRHMGEVTFDGDRLITGQLAATMMACPGERGRADAWLADFFAEPLTWSATGDALTLRRGAETVELVERKNAALVGPTWTVDAIVHSSGIESSATIERVTPTLRFGTDGTVTGFTGCNSLNGTATVTGNKIEFRAVATTKKACEPEVNRIEKAVLDTLRGAATYRIDGQSLALTNGADPAIGLRLKTG